jgi:HEAT repeat protein
VKRAAYTALGYVAPRLDAETRLETARAILDALARDRDGLSRGLGQIALAQLVRADLRDPEGSPVVASTRATQVLLSEARSGPTPSRGFSALALGLAAAEAKKDTGAATRTSAVFRTEAEAVLLRELARRAVADDLRGAFAVAVGLAGIEAAREPLLSLLGDQGASTELRGHAAVALAQVAPPEPDVLKALHLALAEIRLPDLRRQSALALALLGGRSAAVQLVRQMRTGRTELLLAQIVVALGRLGELSTVSALQAVAKDASRSELARSLAVVALGLLTDPEPRPSLLRLTQDAFYPARTSALGEAFSIL